MDPNMLLLNDYLVSRSRIQLLCPNMGHNYIRRAEVASANAAQRRLPPRMRRPSAGGDCQARLTSSCIPWKMLRDITRYSQDPVWKGNRHGTPGRWETTVLMLGLLPVPGRTRCSLISSRPRCLSLLISKANFNMWLPEMHVKAHWSQHVVPARTPPR